MHVSLHILKLNLEMLFLSLDNFPPIYSLCQFSLQSFGNGIKLVAIISQLKTKSANSIRQQQQSNTQATMKNATFIKFSTFSITKEGAKNNSV